MRGFIRKYLTPFTAILFGFLIAFILAEISVRILFPHSRDHIVPGRLFRMDPDLGWSLRNGESGRHQTKNFDVQYRVNAFGYRDRERVSDKNPGVQRVLLYGDSQAFGWGLPMEDRYSDLLEDRIPNVEVWNLAVPGYGLDQEFLSFERDAKQFSPNVAIFLTSQNTLPRTQYRYKYKKYKPQFLLDDAGDVTLIPVPVTGRLISDLLYQGIGWLYLPYFLERQFKVLNSKLLTAEVPRPALGPLETINGRILLRAKDVANSSGIRMAILNSVLDAKRSELEAFCKAQGIGFLHYELSG